MDILHGEAHAPVLVLLAGLRTPWVRPSLFTTGHGEGQAAITMCVFRATLTNDVSLDSSRLPSLAPSMSP